MEKLGQSSAESSAESLAISSIESLPINSTFSSTTDLSSISSPNDDSEIRTLSTSPINSQTSSEIMNMRKIFNIQKYVETLKDIKIFLEAQLQNLLNVINNNKKLSAIDKNRLLEFYNFVKKDINNIWTPLHKIKYDVAAFDIALGFIKQIPRIQDLKPAFELINNPKNDKDSAFLKQYGLGKKKKTKNPKKKTLKKTLKKTPKKKTPKKKTLKKTPKKTPKKTLKKTPKKTPKKKTLKKTPKKTLKRSAKKRRSAKK